MLMLVCRSNIQTRHILYRNILPLLLNRSLPHSHQYLLRLPPPHASFSSSSSSTARLRKQSSINMNASVSAPSPAAAASSTTPSLIKQTSTTITQGPCPTPTQFNRSDSFNIVSWNCNGLRSISMKPNLPLSTLFSSYSSDIFCFQETKMSAFSDISLTDHIVPGYDSFFSFSKGRKGWSGVATYVRQGCTVSAVEDLGSINTDGEGRILVTDHGRFILLNVYFPNGRGGERVEYKMKFYQTVEEYVRKLTIDQKRHVIIVGDFNTAHHPIDLWNTEGLSEEKCKALEKSVTISGFLPQERAWLDSMVKQGVTNGSVEEERRKRQREGGIASKEESKDEDYDMDFIHAPIHATASTTTTPTTVPPSSAPLTAASSTNVDIASSATSSSPLFIDSYRYFHPYQRQAYTFWDMRTQARQVGQGWRIDMMMVDESLMIECGADADIHSRQRGSDHCPTSLHFHLPPIQTESASSAASSSTTVAASSTATTPALSLDHPSRLARITSFLRLHPFPYPSPTSSVSTSKVLNLKAQQRQPSVQSFFGVKSTAAAAAAAISSSPSSSIAATGGRSGEKKRKLDEVDTVPAASDIDQNNLLAQHPSSSASSMLSTFPSSSSTTTISTISRSKSPTPPSPSRVTKKPKLSAATRKLSVGKGQTSIADVFAPRDLTTNNNGSSNGGNTNSS